jgi:hypothetical protein
MPVWRSEWKTTGPSSVFGSAARSRAFVNALCTSLGCLLSPARFRKTKPVPSESCRSSRLGYACRQLAAERAASQPSDDDVLASLARLGVAASASQVAESLYRNRPSPSAVVRVGLALSRLASKGRVRRVEVAGHAETRNRWEVVSEK